MDHLSKRSNYSVWSLVLLRVVGKYVYETTKTCHARNLVGAIIWGFFRCKKIRNKNGERVLMVVQFWVTCETKYLAYVELKL